MERKISIDYNRNGFYPFHGAASIRRNTKLYKNGMMKGKDRKETRSQRASQLSKILSSYKEKKKNQKFY